MSRNKYDLFINKIEENELKKKVVYVKCDCRYLAIRQKNSVALFRCSICCTEYMLNRSGRVIKKMNNSHI